MSYTSRIVENLREGRFVHVTGELLLIVAGILIALAVDGWIEDRKEQQLERESLELLSTDLTLLSEQIREFTTYQEDLLRAAGFAYRTLATATEIPSDEKLARALGKIISRRTLKLPRVAYEELIATGNLRLIRNRLLRRRVVRFYQDLDRDGEIVARNNQAFVDEMVVRFFVGEGMFVPQFSPDDPVGSVLGDGLALYQQEIPVAASPLTGRLWEMEDVDPAWEKTRSLVAQAALAAAMNVDRGRRIEARAAALIDAIEAELDSRFRA